MATYRIESRNPAIDPVMVRATSVEHAAQVATRRLYGRTRGLYARRVTGDAGKSGYFQAYVPSKTGGATSYGRNFHVQEMWRSKEKDTMSMIRSSWGLLPGHVIAHLWRIWDDRESGGGYGAEALCGKRTGATLTELACPTKKCRMCQVAQRPHTQRKD